MSAPSLAAPELRRTGTGQPVLLLHPLGVVSFWDGVVPALEGLDVLTYDFPGHGRTPVPAAPYTIEDLSEQAAGLLADAGHEVVDVVGVSLGGLVAQRLAVDHPELVRRLVVVDVVAVYPSALQQQWRDRAARTPADGLGPLIDPQPVVHCRPAG